MAIQIDVTFECKSYNSTSHKARLFSGDVWDFSGVEIKEYEEVTIHFFCNDPSAYLEIELFDSFEPARLHSGESKIIITGKDSDEMFVPGYYPIRVITTNGTYKALYKIIPNSLTWEALVNLRSYLEHLLIGLSYDLLKYRSGININKGNGFPTNIQKYEYIENNHLKIIHDINAIFKHPIYNLTKEYKLQQVSKKPDVKSLRWLYKKGVSLNGYNSPIVVKEKHSTLSLDNCENRWLLRIIRFVQFTLRQLDNELLESELVNKERLLNLESKLEELKDRYEKIRDKWFITKDKNALYKQIRHLENQISSNAKQGLNIIKHKTKIRNILSTFSHYEHDSWLQTFDKKISSERPTIRLLKDRRYANLYRFYKELISIEKQNSSIKLKTFPFKKTSLLFEYYVLALVIRALESQGFIWDSGWLADSKNPLLLVSELNDDITLDFSKGDFKIELAYDKEVEHNKVKQVESHYIANNHRKPDIRLSLFDDKKMLVRSLIIEVKYRKFASLWNKNADTDAFKQLKDYLNIRYYDAVLGKLNTSPIKKVLVLYPKQEGVKAIRHEHYNTITFLQIEPCDPGEGIEPFGYDGLVSLVNEYLLEDTMVTNESTEDPKIQKWLMNRLKN